MNYQNLYDVIIIGAGASGLSCAHYLKANGVSSTLVLEGKDRYGGRVHQLQGKSDYGLERGGEEVYCADGEYFKLIKKAGGIMIPRKDDLTYIEHPTEQRMMKVNEFQKSYPNEAFIIENLSDEKLGMTKKLGDNISMKEAWNKLNLNKNFTFWGEAIFGTENGGKWDDVGIAQVVDKESMFPTFSDVHMITNMTHYQVFTKVFQDILGKIVFNEVVYFIDYSENRIKVFTQKGNVYYCKKVVVSSSIKVLQNKFIKFLPELPAPKQQVIDQIKIDSMGKLHMKFKQPVFSEDVKIFYLNYKCIFGWVSSDGRSKTDYILVFLLCSDYCDEYDQNNQKFIDGLLEHVQKLTKVNLKENLLDKDFLNWGKEFLIEGAHTFDSVGQKKNAREILSQNINEKVYFIGEASNAFGKQGCINGAIDTGINIALQISQRHKNAQNNVKSQPQVESLLINPSL